MAMVSGSISRAVEDAIHDYEDSRLHDLVHAAGGPYAIKFVASKWAANYASPTRLKISDTPAQTWGTATYVTPLAFPLSSALYGRVGLVTEFSPSGWRVFDATDPAARMAYVRWVRLQPAFSDLVLTVHSTQANQFLRNKFRRDFRIDCVLFNPDQEADLHTDRAKHVWMAVTDWTSTGEIDSSFSDRLAKARFTVLIDEDFALEVTGLPIRRAERQIEKVTEKILLHHCIDICTARVDATLPGQVIQHYCAGSYLHLYIEP